ncbi:hypothetical protein [Pedobacter sp. SYP-B3415]|uniref:hypothetical protein n=1 Tax=Pedobacter sp. SYP-B3415 TaxID=2496641 RepID=UPI0013EA0BED|nr:hypothetical protein [Pedobacter sp. SYP-B3415]
MDKYGLLNSVDVLAGGDIARWNDIMRMRYEKVFVKLMMNKDLVNYQERYAEIMRKK